MKRCLICGEVLVDGVCPNTATHFKKMCINCSDCLEKDGICFCCNEKNKEDYLRKIKSDIAAMTANAPYKINNINIEVEPVPLKDALKKCKNWTLDHKAVDYFTAIAEK